jgi:hypothetical protein
LVAICSPFRVWNEEEIEMAENAAPRTRHGETFWRAHHEVWQRSDLNQREYCDSQGLPPASTADGAELSRTLCAASLTPLSPASSWPSFPLPGEAPPFMS